MSCHQVILKCTEMLQMCHMQHYSFTNPPFAAFILVEKTAFFAEDRTTILRTQWSES
jgi:hypothetical protein